MSDNTKQQVDPNSAKFKQGVEAGLNSPADSKNWEAGNELGQELKAEGESEETVADPLVNETSAPPLVKDRESSTANLQDEKDESEE